jgi:hypothetical protein
VLILDAKSLVLAMGAPQRQRLSGAPVDPSRGFSGWVALPHALITAFTGTALIDGEERTRELVNSDLNPDLNDDILVVIEAADLATEQDLKPERDLGRPYYILTRDDRLETIDKATTLLMYDKVQRYGQEETERVGATSGGAAAAIAYVSSSRRTHR